VQPSSTTTFMAGTNWMKQAACLNRDDLDWFDLDCTLQACLAVCATCPVADDCLDYAVRHECGEGVWGGEWGYRLGVLIRQGGAT
jgi:WhiB family redox-sensing transcriptional regulator